MLTLIILVHFILYDVRVLGHSRKYRDAVRSHDEQLEYKEKHICSSCVNPLLLQGGLVIQNEPLHIALEKGKHIKVCIESFQNTLCSGAN